eukprot:Sdes_comp21259_c0_seq1m19906
MSTSATVYRFLSFAKKNRGVVHETAESAVRAASVSQEAFATLLWRNFCIIMNSRKYFSKSNAVKTVQNAFGRRLQGLASVVPIGLTSICMLTPKHVVHAYVSEEDSENITCIGEAIFSKGPNDAAEAVILSLQGDLRGRSRVLFDIARNAIVGIPKVRVLLPPESKIETTLSHFSSPTSRLSLPFVSATPNPLDACSDPKKDLSSEEVQEENAPCRTKDNSTLAEKCIKLTALIVAYDVILLSAYFTVKFLVS